MILIIESLMLNLMLIIIIMLLIIIHLNRNFRVIDTKMTKKVKLVSITYPFYDEKDKKNMEQIYKRENYLKMLEDFIMIMNLSI